MAERVSTAWRLLPLSGVAIAALALAVTGCKSELPKRAADLPPHPVIEAVAPEALQPVHYLGSSAPRIATSRVDALGRAVTLACATCHQHLDPDPTERGAELEAFHGGLTMQHGDLSCVSCHDASARYAGLRLADGERVPFEQTMTLCRQCHGPQARDYARGSHGGMTGYWDRTRGGRVRNTCTVCHDPHAPAYQGMIPAPPPIDRSVVSPDDDDHPSSPTPGAAHD